MRGQSHRSHCGPACVANVLRLFGMNPEATEDTVARKMRLLVTRAGGHVDAGDPSEGTSERQISAALSAYRLHHESVDPHDPTLALAALKGWLTGGACALLCVDAHQHWVLAIGVCGDRILVADPADPEIVLSVTAKEVAERWRMAGDPPSFFALVVYPKHGRGRRV